MNIAVIPARGGSKRIPRKNIKDFFGKPIIAYSIVAAQESGCFDRIVVSTDDHEIAEVAGKWGAEVPFIRPESLSGDYIGTLPVMRHAVEWARSTTPGFLKACCIYATAPFLQANDLRRGLGVLDSSGSDYAFSVTSYAFPIQRAIRINGDGRIEMFQPDQFATRSQDLEEAWHDAGQFYWGLCDAWLEQKPLFSPNSCPVPIPRHRVQDIDTLEDWTRAELMYAVQSRDHG